MCLFICISVISLQSDFIDSLFMIQVLLVIVMSENALRDLNTLPGSERKNESSSKGAFTKPCNGNTDENAEGWNRKMSDLSVPVPVNGGETLNPGVDVGNSEVEYIESENLSDVEDVDTSIKVF